MILMDVNVLVYSHREDAPRHRQFRNWLEAVINSPASYGITDLVLSGFLRIVTHPKIFKPPSPMEKALDFAKQIRNQPNAVVISPGPRHWTIFNELCRIPRVKGNLIADAYLAALAIESECEWVTSDRDYRLFPQLRMRHPLGD